MTVLLQSLSIFMMMWVLIAAAVAMAGKPPTQKAYVGGTVVSAVLLLTGLLFKDTWTVIFQSIALFGWGGGLLARTIKLRRAARQ